jgi:hypothetical protein
MVVEKELTRNSLGSSYSLLLKVDRKSIKPVSNGGRFYWRKESDVD